MKAIILAQSNKPPRYPNEIEAERLAEEKEADARFDRWNDERS